MTKAQLRKIYKEKRKLISPKEKANWSDRILVNFKKLKLPYINCVHTYFAMDEQNEVDTQNILRYLKFANPGLITIAPKINIDTGEMLNYIFNENTRLAANKFSIAEPVDGEIIESVNIDLVLTPLLAFDAKGYRVGYGKGFYDKFLEQCRSNVIKAGLSFFEAEEAIDDVSQFDIPLNYCITPHTINCF